MYRYILNRLLLSIPTLIGAAALGVHPDASDPRRPSAWCGWARAVRSTRRRSPTATPSSVSTVRWCCSSSTSLAGFARAISHVDVVGQAGQPGDRHAHPGVAGDRPAGHSGGGADRHPLGTISALHQNSWLDHIVRTVAIAGIATPSFWLGIMSILVVLEVSHLAFGAPWMPPIDYVSLWTIRCATCRS